MSQTPADELDTGKKFHTAFYLPPRFPEDPPIRSKGKGKAREGIGVQSKAKVTADLRKQLETTIYRLLVTAHSRDEFIDLRGELFPDFVRLSITISTLAPVLKEDSTIAANEVFASIAKQFSSDVRLLTRIDGAAEEAQFCLETLHRAHFLAEDVRAGLRNGTIPRESEKAYGEAISEEWWSILHLRCLAYAIRHSISPTDEVLMALLEGFRHSVMAYAHAREAIEPRYRADYDSIDFSALTTNDGDYAPFDNAFGA